MVPSISTMTIGFIDRVLPLRNDPITQFRNLICLPEEIIHSLDDLASVIGFVYGFAQSTPIAHAVREPRAELLHLADDPVAFLVHQHLEIRLDELVTVALGGLVVT